MPTLKSRRTGQDLRFHPFVAEWKKIASVPEGVAVLLFDEEWDMTLGAIQVGYANDMGDFHVEACPDFKPTHWMPLPSPPPETMR